MSSEEIKTEADTTECSHVDKPSTGMFAVSDCSCIVFKRVVSPSNRTVLVN